MRTRLLLVMAATAIIATGCFKVNVAIDVNEDGSGTLEGLTAVNFETAAPLLGAFGDDTDDLSSVDQICDNFALDSGIEVSELSATPYREGDFCGVEFSDTFGPGEFTNATSALGEGGGDAILRQEPDGGWYFEVPFDAEDFGAGELPPGFGDLFDDAEYIFKVRLPGRQVDHNGTIDADGFVVWDVDLSGAPETLFLRTEPGERITNSDGGGALTVILIVVAVLAALGLAAWFLMRNRTDAQDPPASGVAATVQGGAPSTPPIDPTMPPTMAPNDVSGVHRTPPDAGTPTTADDWGAPTTADVAPSDPTSVAEPAPEPAPAPAPVAPQVIASPTPEQATGSPVWDPVRRRYVQWDPNGSRWLVFDDTTQTWGPEA